MLAKLTDCGLEFVEKEKAPGKEGELLEARLEARFVWLVELRPAELLPALGAREWLIAFLAEIRRSWKSRYAGISLRSTGVSSCEKYNGCSGGMSAMFEAFGESCIASNIAAEDPIGVEGTLSRPAEVSLSPRSDMRPMVNLRS